MTTYPFEIDGEQIERLGVEFAGFINHLLDAQSRAEGLAGGALKTTSKQDTADGGVDAVLEGSRGTTWVPEGDSAWQFKRTDLLPAKCRAELEGAEFARDLLLSGASYVLALGARLTAKQIKIRRSALLDVAAALLGSRDLAKERVHVLDANQLGRWTRLFPSVAAYPPLRTALGSLVDFERWADSEGHQIAWTPDERRAVLVKDDLLHVVGDVFDTLEEAHRRGRP